MVRRWIVCITVCLSIGLPRVCGAADFGFSIGQPISVFNVLGGEDLNDVGSRIGVRLDRWYPFGTIDFARVTRRKSFASSDFETRRLQWTLLTLGGGVRYQFRETEARQVVPYAVGEVLTAIPISNRESSGGLSLNRLDRASSVGFATGGGASYYVTDHFAVGGEMGGLGLFVSVDRAAQTTRISILQWYTSLRLAFFF